MNKLKPIAILILINCMALLTAKSQDIRIIGGQNITIDQAPWQVLFEIGSDDKCGGVILTSEWIVTAAHCIYDAGATIQNSRIIAGITFRSQKSTGQIRNISEIIVHEDYGLTPAGTPNNDIALLKLSTPLTFNQNVQPIAAATAVDAANGLLNPGVNGTITGWGRDDFGNQPDQLQSVTIPIISAQQSDSLGSIVTSNMIPLYQQGKAAAPGDSGGPMVVAGSNGHILGGVCSWGYFPKDMNPTIYIQESQITVVGYGNV